MLMLYRKKLQILQIKDIAWSLTIFKKLNLYTIKIFFNFAQILNQTNG